MRRDESDAAWSLAIMRTAAMPQREKFMKSSLQVAWGEAIRPPIAPGVGADALKQGGANRRIPSLFPHIDSARLRNATLDITISSRGTADTGVAFAAVMSSCPPAVSFAEFGAVVAVLPRVNQIEHVRPTCARGPRSLWTSQIAPGQASDYLAQAPVFIRISRLRRSGAIRPPLRLRDPQTRRQRANEATVFG